MRKIKLADSARRSSTRRATGRKSMCVTATTSGERFGLWGTPMVQRPGRNAPCPCGSGRKYKRCHLSDLHDPLLGVRPHVVEKFTAGAKVGSRAVFSREVLAPSLRQGIARLEAMGIRVPPGSRIPRYLELTEDLPDLSKPDPRLTERAIAFTEGLSLAMVFNGLPRLRDTPRLRETLQKIVSGEFAATGDDSARATQLELWFASMCAAAGMDAELRDPPDVVFTMDGDMYSAAAKRPQSLRKMSDQLKKGVDQINASACPGLLVIDLTRAWGFNTEALRVRHHSEAKALMDSKARKLVEMRLPERFLIPRDPERQVLGIVCVIHALLLDESVPGYLAGCWIRLEPLRHDDRDLHPVLHRLLAAPINPSDHLS